MSLMIKSLDVAAKGGQYLVRGLEAAGKVAWYLGRCVRLANAAGDVVQTVKDDQLSTGRKIVRVAADVGVIGFEGASGIGRIAGAAPNLQLSLEAGAASFDIIQNVAVLSCKKEIKVGDWVDLGCLVIFRAANVSRTAVTLKPEVFNDQGESIKNVADILEGGAFLVLERDLVAAAAHKGYVLAKNQVIAIFRYCQNFNQASLDVPLDEDFGDENYPELRVDAQTRAAIDEIQKAESIDEFDLIPELFIRDPELSKRICPITKRPIRHILIVRKRENLYYEQEELITCLSKGQKPEKWPDDIPFERKNLAYSSSLQNEIDTRLRALFDEFKEISPNISTKQRLIVLAKQLGIGHRKASEEIGDHLLEVLPQGVVSSISVQKVQYAFAGGRKKLATRIAVQAKRVFGLGSELTAQEQKNAMCAFLGSADESERNDLRKVIKSFNKIEIFIADDLQNVSGIFVR